MATETVGARYTIELNSTLILAVIVYHLLLVLLHICVAGKPAKTSRGKKEPPISSSSGEEEPVFVSCKAPPLYISSTRGGECYHTKSKCGKLSCARNVKELRPCSTCCSIITFHGK